MVLCNETYPCLKVCWEQFPPGRYSLIRTVPQPHQYVHRFHPYQDIVAPVIWEVAEGQVVHQKIPLGVE